LPTIFTHSFFGLTLSSFILKNKPKRFYFLTILATVIPDCDVIAFKLGFPYEHWLGHRGFSHSILFAILLGGLCSLFFHTDRFISKERFYFSIWFFIATLSHGFLDAFTDGGLGVGFFIPLNNTRYFFPFRPIKVSPIGVKSFLSNQGLATLSSEFLWIWIPGMTFYLFRFITKKVNSK
jgi:inner membrane protein